MSRPSFPRARRRRTRVAVAAAAIVASPLAAAQAPPGEPPTQLAPVVVTASRTPQPITSAIADVSVIGAEEIAANGPRGLAELLQGRHGVEVVQNGGPGATSGVFMRGANRGQTLLLVDGLRVSSSTVGAPTFEAIPLDQAERVEVLRGPASSLYGADAIGGVIQVFTRRPAPGLSGWVNGGLGTYDTRMLTGGVSAGMGAVAVSLSGGYRRSDGFNATTDALSFVWNPDRDGYVNNDVGASVVATFAPDQEASARYLRSDLDAQFDGGGSFDDRTHTTLEVWQVASRNRLGAGWTSRLSIGQSTDESVSSTAFGDYPFRTRDRQYGWQNEFVVPHGTATLAVERREERIDDSVGFAVTARDTNAIVGVVQLARGEHEIQANLRHDHSSQYGGQTTGAIAWAWRFAPSWRATASYGTGFKPPSFNDLYYPDLQREPRARDRAQCRGGHRAGRDGRRVAHGRPRDRLVQQDRPADRFPVRRVVQLRAQNVARATLTGVSLIGDASWRGASVTASVDLQDPKDDVTGKPLPRRARQYGALALSQATGPVQLGVQVIASSYRYDDAENTRRLGGYTIVNFTAEWTVGRGVTVLARGDNVTDRDYALAYGFATGGARAFVGVRWQP